MCWHNDTAVCLECGEERKLTSRELNRAAKPRCLSCGGPIELTRTTRERFAERRSLSLDLRGGGRCAVTKLRA